MRYACLHIPEFLLQAALRDEREAFERPVALVDGPPSCRSVIATTAKAREARIRAGMTQAHAAAAAEIRLRSPSQEDSAHAALLDCARSSSPRVEDTSVDTVTLDLGGMGKLLGSPSVVASRLLRRAEELGLAANVALAANPDTAILAARGFKGITLISPGEEKRRLGELPVSVLDPPPETLAALERWGIVRLKQLAALPPLPLSERLGREGIQLRRLARGEYSRELIVIQGKPHFEEAWELEEPAVTLEGLEFVLSRLLVRLSSRLSARSLAAQSLRLRMDLATGYEPEPGLALEEQRREGRDERQETRDGKHNPSPALVPRALSPRSRGEGRDHQIPSSFPSSLASGLSTLPCSDSSLASRPLPLLYERSLSFPCPVNEARLFFKLWWLRLESDHPSAPVVKVTITAEPARPRAAQGGLFVPPAPDPEKLELTLARVASVVGKDNVGSPELIDTHRPHAFRMVPFNPPQPPLNPVLPKEGSQAKIALRHFRPPLRVHVELKAGQPVRLFSSRLSGSILSAAGPWRLSGGWWNEDGWNSEEWDIEVQAGEQKALYRLCLDRTQGEWYVEGEYD